MHSTSTPGSRSASLTRALCRLCCCLRPRIPQAHISLCVVHVWGVCAYGCAMDGGACVRRVACRDPSVPSVMATDAPGRASSTEHSSVVLVVSSLSTAPPADGGDRFRLHLPTLARRSAHTPRTRRHSRARLVADRRAPRAAAVALRPAGARLEAVGCRVRGELESEWASC